jgi:hypothetical protein
MRRLAAFVVAVMLTACDSGGPAAIIASGGNSSIAGSYTLRTVSGAPLPFTFAQMGADKYEVLSDAITLTDAGRWTEVWQERQTISGVISTPTYRDAGVFTLNGTAIRFTGGTSDTLFVGTLVGNTLSLTGVLSTGQPVPEVFMK